MARPKFSNGGLLQLNFQVKFQDKGFKSWLNKIKTFIRYSATIGIHSADAKKKVTKRYIGTNGKGHVSGKSYSMTIAKLAYQNEFGANIPVKAKYITKSRTIKSVYHTLRHRQTFRTIQKYSALASANKQGYLILDKRGKFVAYFKPGSVIHIPARPFIRKILFEPDKALEISINAVLSTTFIKNGHSARAGFKLIAELVQQSMKKNVHHNQKANHPITQKAKGFNVPLYEQQDRLAKAITYKIYKDTFVKGTKGNLQYTVQKNIKIIDKLKKTIDQFTDHGMISSTTLDPIVKEYKGINPNFEFKDYFK